MYRAKIPAFWTQLEGAASQMPLSCHRPRNYVTHFTFLLRFFELLGVFIRFDEVEEINLEIMIPLVVLSL